MWYFNCSTPYEGSVNKIWNLSHDLNATILLGVFLKWSNYKPTVWPVAWGYKIFLEWNLGYWGQHVENIDIKTCMARNYNISTTSPQWLLQDCGISSALEIQKNFLTKMKFAILSQKQFSILFYWLVSSDPKIMPSHECKATLLMISQHWFR